MPDITVSIDANGAFSPSDLQVQPGDRVTFVAASDTVLCVAPAAVFGDERFEIPGDEQRTLLVQSAGNGRLDFVARVGDLDAPCRGGGRDRTSRGGGTVGGGPD